MFSEVAEIALVAARLGQFQKLLKTCVILILNITRPIRLHIIISTTSALLRNKFLFYNFCYVAEEIKFFAYLFTDELSVNSLFSLFILSYVSQIQDIVLHLLSRPYRPPKDIKM